jgi:ankyrin repeat protein
MFELIDIKKIHKQKYNGLVSACKNGHIDIVKLIINKCHVTDSDIGNAVIKACKYKNWNIVEFLMDHKPYYFADIFEHICGSGNIDLFNRVRSKILKLHNAKSYLYIACKNGHPEIVKLLIQYVTQKNIMKGYAYAYENNHIQICDYFSSIGIINWHSHFLGACRTNDIKLLELSLQHGVSDIKVGFIIACTEGSLDIVKLLVDKVSKVRYVNDGFCEACNNGHYDVVNFLIDKQTTDFYWFGSLCYKNRINIVKLLLERCGKKITIQTLNNGLYNACVNNNIDMIDVLIFYGANDWNIGLSGACKSGNYELMMCMIKMGAKTCSTCERTSIEHTREFDCILNHFCL